jgi:hypothetical protein
VCRCDTCEADKRWDWELRWKPAPDQRNAYANEIAGSLLHYVKNANDILRPLYGQLTGHCGICGRFIYEPESKRLGIGPDCRGYR